MTELQRLIRVSYGSADNKFSGHGSDTEQAAKAIVQANKENIGLKEYLELHREYLKLQGCQENHISEQLEKIKDISSYFIYD